MRLSFFPARLYKWIYVPHRETQRLGYLFFFDWFFAMNSVPGWGM